MKYVVADGQPAMAMLVERLLMNVRISVADEIHTVQSGERLLEVLIRSESQASIAILDPAIGALKRLALIRDLRERCPATRLIVYAAEESPFLATRIIAEGVRGYVFKTSPTRTLIRAVKQVQADDTFYDPRIDFQRAKTDPWSSLTPKQQEVCLLVLRHGSIRRVAESEKRNYDTIWTHWSNAKKALGLRHEAELAKHFYEKGLMHLLDD
ncbi:MAG: response regulator [Lysobacter sp.]